jgi:hypothetical protein
MVPILVNSKFKSRGSKCPRCGAKALEKEKRALCTECDDYSWSSQMKKITYKSDRDDLPNHGICIYCW